MITPTLELEQKLWKSGYTMVCGLDEVGRGSFAGPVVVGAVVFPKNSMKLNGIVDSKLLKPRQREGLAVRIKDRALAWSIAEIGVSNINRIGIGKAAQMAFRKALRLLPVQADFILIDAFYIKHLNRKKQKAVKDGDKICASISAASIIAKVYRDKLMKKLHYKYPKYRFGKHKGYGTRLHQEMIKLHGLTAVHRKSFNLGRFLNN